jgi:hypothetical protein
MTCGEVLRPLDKLGVTGSSPVPPIALSKPFEQRKEAPRGALFVCGGVLVAFRI